MKTRIFVVAVMVLTIVGTAPAVLSAPLSNGFQPITNPQISLTNTRTWILQGTRVSGQACRYAYSSAPKDVPADGWAQITIGVDQSTCRKLMQEGTPTSQADLRAAAGLPATNSPSGLAPTSSRGAYQIVVFYDVANIQLTGETTQIHWSYDGTNVSGGSTTKSCLTGPSWWHLSYCTSSDGYVPGSYLGNSWASFYSDFCAPLPRTYVYQYYNKVWGHPDGTAAVAQSSDSVDECILLHSSVYTGYN